VHLNFEILKALPKTQCLSPTLNFLVQVHYLGKERLDSALLQVRVMIEPKIKDYSLSELKRIERRFGPPESLNNILWCEKMLLLNRTNSIQTVDLPIEIRDDHESAMWYYFSSLEGGEIFLKFFFSGICYLLAEDKITVRSIPWSSECSYLMPYEIWKETLFRYYPDSLWIRLDHSLYERPQDYQLSHRLPSLQTALERLLDKEQTETRRIG